MYFIDEMKTGLIILLIYLLPASASGNPVAAAEARKWRVSHEQKIVDGFVELLSIPNVASDSVNIKRNAEFISELLEARNFEVQLLGVEGSPPAVYAERREPGADTTLMIYVHYDGQPVNPKNWSSGPWQPVMRDAPVEQGGRIVDMQAPFDPEWRIFGRSASDDKAPIIALTAALDAMDAAGIPLSVNLKLFLEGEEEAGSPHLWEMLTKYRDILGADLWLFCDGPVHQSRNWVLNYGVRGTYGFALTVYGANRPLHSGHYGNWTPNPIMLLNELIGTMRDSRGNVLVEGFYDQVIPATDQEFAAIDAAPGVDEKLIEELGIGHPESDERLELAILRPAMNLRGIRSGDVGALARNSIPTSASASIGLRLVPAQTPQYLKEIIEAHIRHQGYFISSEEPTAAARAIHDRFARLEWAGAGYPAYRAPLDLPLAQSITSIMNQLHDDKVIQSPTMGGSLPLYVIEEVIGAPILILPIANHDNNQHGSDENLRLQNLWDGIEIYSAILTGL
jgi:acetylornithine deacetylase/succinyl-diaminopimelate desuccinylase-like protein